MTSTETHPIYVVYDHIIKDPVGFFADPDAAIAAATKYVNEDYQGQTHRYDDVESPSVAVYKAPFDRILTEEEDILDDCIWDAIDLEDED